MDYRPLHKIMLVEDDTDIQQIVEISLSSMGGYEVLVCTSGYEALEKAGIFDPDIILLDVMMPGLDGPSTLRGLREIATTSKTPVIFLTAKVMPQEVDEYKNMGAVDVISKPFNPLTLADRINKTWETLYIQAPSLFTKSPKLVLLAKKYGKRLPEKWIEINSSWISWQENPDSPYSHVQELILLTHKLAGSAATYGYKEVSVASKEIEKYLEALPSNRNDLSPKEKGHIEHLIKQLEKAIRTEEKPQSNR